MTDTKKRTAYTPGPWTHENNDHIMNLDGDAVAVTSGFGPEDRANARLIARAPELVEALRECVETWGPMLADADLDAGSNPAWLTVEHALALLAEIDGTAK